MLFAAFGTESLGNTALPTRRPVNGRSPPARGGPAPEPFAAMLRAARADRPAPRRALVERVRLQIANGSYETQAKIEALLPRLAGDLGLTRTR
jgi:hypothetical protein